MRIAVRSLEGRVVRGGTNERMRAESRCLYTKVADHLTLRQAFDVPENLAPRQHRPS